MELSFSQTMHITLVRPASWMFNVACKNRKDHDERKLKQN